MLLLERDEAIGQIAEQIYAELKAAGAEVLFDDRNERPGAKFADADLFGIPFQIVCGKTTRENGEVEIRRRGQKDSETAPAKEAVSRVMGFLA